MQTVSNVSAPARPLMLEKISTLINALSNMPSLLELNMDSSIVQDNAISSLVANITSLQTLKASVIFSRVTPDFSRLVALKKLQINDYGFSFSGNLTTSLMSVSRASLTDLDVTSPLPDFGVLSRFSHLETLSLNLLGTANFSLTYLTSPYLRELSMIGLPQSATSLDFSSFSSNLTKLQLTSGYVSAITAWPPAVEDIWISSMTALDSFDGSSSALPPTVSSFLLSSLNSFSQFPNGFFAAPMSAGSVKTITFANMPGMTTLPAELVNATSLDLIILTATAIVDPQELCHLPTTLRKLVIQGNAGFGPLPFPSCFASFTQLWNVELSSMNIGPQNVTANLPPTVTHLRASLLTPRGSNVQYNWPVFVQSLPNLEVLQITGCGLSGTFPDELRALKQLQALHLSYNSLTGPIDPTFFTALNSSISIDLTTNLLNGAVPTQFSPTLQQLYLRGNYFSTFSDPPQPVPNLAYLDLYGNRLTSLPTTAGWAQFSSLRVLYLTANPLGTPVPTFWANHSAITNVALSSCGFTGTLPEIASPLLNYVDLSYNGLCGSLPTIQPTTPLRALNLRANSLSGTIPASWATTDFVLLDLSNNRLTGNLSDLAAFAANQTTMTSLQLRDNDFFGNLPNMSKMTALLWLDVSNTLVELCDANPSFAPSVISCYTNNLPNGGTCPCKSWYACAPILCTSTVPFVPHSTGPISFASCGTSAIPLPSFATCDYATQPSPAFSCVDGVWTATDSVTSPIVVSTPIVVVSGNLSAPVTITNPSSSIIVKECVSSNATIEIVLTPAQVELLQKDPSSKLLLTQLGTSCPDSVSTVHVSASISGKTCKKVRASDDTGKSDHVSLFVVFKIGTSSCNVWWIVLVSVLGGLAVVAIGGFVVLFKVKPVRKRFLPSTST